MIIIDGKQISASLKESIREQVARLPEKYGRVPHLVVVRVGEDPASVVYVRNKAKACEVCGIRNTTIVLPEETTQKALLQKVREAGYEDIHRTVGTFPNFDSSGTLMNRGVGGIYKLSQDDGSGDAVPQLFSPADRAFHSFGAGSELQLRAKRLKEIATLKAHCLGHAILRDGLCARVG